MKNFREKQLQEQQLRKLISRLNIPVETPIERANRLRERIEAGRDHDLFLHVETSLQVASKKNDLASIRRSLDSIASADQNSDAIETRKKLLEIGQPEVMYSLVPSLTEKKTNALTSYNSTINKRKKSVVTQNLLLNKTSTVGDMKESMNDKNINLINGARYRRLSNITYANISTLNQGISGGDRVSYNSLHKACESGNWETICLLLTQERNNKHLYVNSFTNMNLTPLMLACQGNHYITVWLLLLHGADISLTSSSGMNCFHYCARMNSTEAFQAIIDFSTYFKRVETLILQDEDRVHRLITFDHNSVNRESLRISLEQMIAQVEKDLVIPKEISKLIKSVNERENKLDEKYEEYRLKINSNNTYMPINSSSSVLSSSSFRSKDSVDLFNPFDDTYIKPSDIKASEYIKMLDGISAIFYMMKIELLMPKVKCTFENVKLLVNGAYNNSNNVKTITKFSLKKEDSLMFSSSSEFHSIIEDTSTTQPIQNKSTQHSLSPLHIASDSNALDFIKQVYNNGLIENVNLITDAGDSPMHYAARNSYFDSFHFLKSIGGDPLLKNLYGDTPQSLLYYQSNY